MRRLALILAATAAASVAADSPYLTGDALQADIARKCAAGCVTFSQDEAAAYEQGMGAILEQRTREAFEAGVRWQMQACPALI